MRHIDIVPKERTKLYDALQKKEAAIRAAGRGTFFRTGRKLKNSAKWKHKAYSGEIALKRQPEHIVSARIRAGARTGEWQMMSAFLGFVDRHFGEDVATITIRYQ
jgi:hypothetical protein